MHPQRRTALATIGVAALLAVDTGRVQAAEVTYDHLHCYKIKDPLKLAALVDLESAQFGLAQDCKVGSAKFFCVPAVKEVDEAEDKTTGAEIEPRLLVGPNAGDRICYKVKCPQPDPPNTAVIDQFGTRTLTKFKTKMLCTAAVKQADVLPGWVGKIEFGTPTPGHDGAQYWEDDDGVDPEEPGCHDAFSDDDCDTPIAGRFGEMCVGPDALDDIFNAVALMPLATAQYLIETNPDADECHPHKKGVGHPDVYDCDAYCKGEEGPGFEGVCVQDVNHCGAGKHSAHCVCTPESPSGAFLDTGSDLPE